jgi:hypothetical protein
MVEATSASNTDHESQSEPQNSPTPEPVLTEEEKQAKAETAKNLGNEALKAGDVAKAISLYSESIGKCLRQLERSSSRL